ncbi:drug/metabolite transporter (DMT)-like permease [Afipia massiliensis]|uniref:Drug/metabolite transporter (DMT)-like permease n=1 Tax=Afipia massiliensis TaxID=211460 RepID=A0A840N050_9BRAD|nr:DMT family transporter [Afipia massiliensis]MBB5051241.1 drug/metabolite transporter (DMT)-like permease [Afipia massiliensis]
MTIAQERFPDTELRMDERDWSRLVLLSVLWGGTFFFTGVALKELPPLTLVFLRLSIATLILLPLLWVNGIRLPAGVAGWRPFAVMALINNVIPFSLLVMAQTYIPSGMASVLNATTPVFTVLVAATFGEERLIFRRVAGVLLGLCGVIILKGYDFDISSNQSIGIALCLGATISFGFSALWATRKLAGTPPIGTATFQLISASLMMAVLASIFDRPWQLQMPGLVTWLAILGIASLSTALAFILFFQIVTRSGASNVMLVTLLVPVSAILLGYFFLGERIEAREIVGALVIASALLVMDGRVFRLFRRSGIA